MNNQQRHSMRPLLVLLVVALTFGVPYVLPNFVSQLAYAVERGQAVAAHKQLETATTLSDSFKRVARTLKSRLRRTSCQAGPACDLTRVLNKPR